ncbi:MULTISPECIES: 3'-5' exonuclease [Streptomyces]|uniref:Exonuclease domain-containing protein n=1 Tax=Streptomyces dengpaensis TaxID=2049881 RepID=A0ABN5ICG8_9ACTN|nr:MULTISPECIES: hypothetical protein [Streptomyces]AVH59925.1 hypothetical protein C4B68_33790 [Streptomyces dengpaensis]PIB09560.1 hypothetical protein B1C81_10465 [Streptomyces sp. HG99]
MTAIAFVDTETLGLDADVHAMWELAIIRRENGVDTEHLWQIKPSKIDLEHADPEALRINGYMDRMVLPEDYWAGDMSHPCGIPHPMKRDELRTVITDLLSDAVMVGSNPAFDAAFLKVFLDATPWHYRTIDVATLAAGYLRGVDLPTGATSTEAQHPFSSRKLSLAVDVDLPGAGVAHTALGDARWARAVHDAVMGGVA